LSMLPLPGGAPFRRENANRTSRELRR
jgi:hypothetical protein